MLFNRVKLRASRVARPLRCRLLGESLEPRTMFAAGTLDGSFGGGIVEVHPGADGFVDEGGRTAIQADGKVVVAGTGWSSGANQHPSFALARYNTDGTLDATFGSGGIVITPIPTGIQQGRIHGLIIETDQKIVVAGTDSDKFEAARYNTDGSLDTTFGTGGLVEVPKIGTYFSDGRADDIAEQADGKYVLTGYSIGLTFENDWAVIRLNHDGSVDTSFGAGGVASHKFTSTTSPEGRSILVQDDQKIVVVGQLDYLSNSWSVVRYTANGALDTSFGKQGIASTTFATSEQVAFQVAQQPDGKLLVAGCPFGNPSGRANGFELARYNTDGSIDTTFNGGQPITAGFAGFGQAEAYQVAVQPNGKILLGGTAQPDKTSIEDFALERFNADGSLDTTFGNSGMARGGFDETVNHWGLSYQNPVSMALTQTGKIVMMGIGEKTINSPPFGFIIARFTGDGSAWLNSTNAFDVDASGAVIPLDALLVINRLNAQGPGALTGSPGNPPYYYDVNGDGSITPIDALLVINKLNQGTAAATLATGVNTSLADQSTNGPTAVSSPAQIAGKNVSAATQSISSAVTSPAAVANRTAAETALPLLSESVNDADSLEELISAIAPQIATQKRSLAAA